MVFEFQDKAVVITGAGSGIGLDLAKTLASRGARLSICDIDGERLRAAKEELERRGAEVYAELVDVAQAWQVEEYCDRTYRALGRVDVLVNNAGVAMSGYLEDLSLEDLQWIIGVNLWGVIHGCYYFYPRMIEQGGGGHIVNLSSAAGLGPLPVLTGYCATKGGVLSFSEVLRGEAACHDIGVSAICPGFASTNIISTARIRSGTGRQDAAEFSERLSRFFDRVNADPARVTRAIIRAIERDRGVVPVGWETHLADISRRISRRLSDAVYKFSLRFMRRIM